MLSILNYFSFFTLCFLLEHGFVLVAWVQQNESVIHIHIIYSLFLRLFSLTGHYRILSRFSCAIHCVCCAQLLSHAKLFVTPMDCRPQGSFDHEILQARILEWIVSSPEDLPNRGIEPGSPALPVDSVPSEPSCKPLPSCCN